MPTRHSSARAALLDSALRLPVATEADFRLRRPPPGADPQHLRIIKDTQLRTRLIAAGLAEGLQSPKGPQRIPSIIRVFPDGDAPAPGRSAGGRPAAAASNGRAESPRTAYGLPSVEEMRQLVARIEAVEREVSAELHGNITVEIDQRKRALATLEGDAFERAFRELDELLAARRQLAGQVRDEAFRRIDADHGFEPRRYLRLLSREPRNAAASAPA